MLEKYTRVCYKGHELGSHECGHYIRFSEHIEVFQGKDNSTPESSRNLEKCINQLPNKHTDLQSLLDSANKIWEDGAALEAKRSSDTVKIRWNRRRRMEQRWRGLSFPNPNRWRHSGTNWGQPILKENLQRRCNLWYIMGNRTWHHRNNRHQSVKMPGGEQTWYFVKKVTVLVSGRRLRSVSVPRKEQHSDQGKQTTLDKISDIRKERIMQKVHRVNDLTNQKQLNISWGTYHFVYPKCQRFKHFKKKI